MRPDIMEIPGLTTEAELDFLQELCKGLPVGRALENGTYQGRATAALCDALGDSRVVTNDNWGMQHHQANSLAIAKANLAKLGFSPMMLTENAPVHQDLIRLHCNDIALLFIDDHHHPKTVTAQLNAYTPHMAVGSVLALHDYGDDGHPGYTEAIDAWIAAHAGDWERIGLVNLLIAFRRIR